MSQFIYLYLKLHKKWLTVNAKYPRVYKESLSGCILNRNPKWSERSISKWYNCFHRTIWDIRNSSTRQETDMDEITKYDVTHHSNEVKESFDALEGKTVSVAGRMMSKRIMGKASFCNIQDLQGNIQSYVARDSIGEEEYKAFERITIVDAVKKYSGVDINEIPSREEAQAAA